MALILQLNPQMTLEPLQRNDLDPSLCWKVGRYSETAFRKGVNLKQASIHQDIADFLLLSPR